MWSEGERKDHFRLGFKREKTSAEYQIGDGIASPGGVRETLYRNGGLEDGIYSCG